MLKDILSVLGGTIWLILRFILIIALSVGAVYCFGTMFMFRFLWEGLIRLAIAAACGAIVFLIIRASREKDGENRYDDGMSGRQY
jgi:hypothetical protein